MIDLMMMNGMTVNLMTPDRVTQWTPRHAR
jgi:hypothetical protein